MLIGHLLGGARVGLPDSYSTCHGEHSLLNLSHACHFEKTPSPIAGQEPHARGKGIACPHAPARADAAKDQMRQESLRHATTPETSGLRWFSKRRRSSPQAAPSHASTGALPVA